MTNTWVGYCGGKNTNPTYESCCGGDGHTEAIKIEYDPAVVSYEKILDIFFRDSSGHSGGSVQYKSAIWTHSEEQKKIALDVATQLGKASRLDILDEAPFYMAEDYHQKYYTKGAGGNCNQQ